MMQKDVLIDVDDPTFSYDVDPITAHSRIAQFYQYRPPYLKEFFEIIADKLNISGTGTLLDLCCGRGELASRFAEFAEHVFAVDGSKEMLDKKIPRENVEYFQADVNNGSLGLPWKVDYIVIGTVIH